MIGILIMTVIAFVLGLILVIVDSKLNKKTETEIYLEKLPGYNCGACGYAGCEGMAIAMQEDIENYKKCRLLKGDKLKELEEFLKEQKKLQK